jgi:hypothetical protein
MPRFVLRVWLPDRPGALGQVASRIGAARGDVVGIEILEQGGGRAIDELVVALPEVHLVELLVRELTEVEGVDVESVQLLGDEEHDPQLALLEAAARQVDTTDEVDRLARLCADVRSAFEAEWAAVVALDGRAVLAVDGAAPAPSWASAFVAGSRHLEGAHEYGADDVAWAELRGIGGVLIVGRSGRPFRARERRQLEVLARISAGLSRPGRGARRTPSPGSVDDPAA